MKRILIKNGILVNEDQQFAADILVEGTYIAKIGTDLSHPNATVIDAQGGYVFPGVIDDQVHFREPGLTHKGCIASESRAAVAGGTTSFMEQPNTNPQTVTLEALEQKMAMGAASSVANYSFLLGGTNDNLEEIKRLDPKATSGIKLFLGSSTGNMLVDDPQVIEKIFRATPLVISAHCEDEATIRAQMAWAQETYGDQMTPELHPVIRNAEACYLSSSRAIALARATGARLHVFHLSTGIEMDLLAPGPLKGKQITAEVCIHHLWFSDEDYATKGNLIKWNPAVKSAADRDALWAGLLEDRIDVIATDHAPHTWEEKNKPYAQAPSGGPLVQHSLVAMLDFVERGKISLNQVVRKMCHNPADLFQVHKRGYLREGYYADIAVVQPKTWTVGKENIVAQCGWSPFEGQSFNYAVTHTLVNGHLAYNQGLISPEIKGMRLTFDR
ncbi:MAG: dihydroorotase [Flavobacteriaceae bacterium]|nr:dihydroorotase [Flavobacteriaceae bacterium]MDP4794451.1 dihydroorotase [Flavobacteriaceae bacterium]MDP5113145.1 dihydroorotase [Flavobacteriaceae bacterium]